jgi:hypothetical protein
MTDEEDTKLDIEAGYHKKEELQKLEDLCFDPDKFEDLENDFKTFMEELIGNANLIKFKDEYAKIWKMLKSSYEQEGRTVKAAKKVIDMIFESSQ